MPDDIAERFAKDTAAHTMTVLRDDGLYRHLRFVRVTPNAKTGKPERSSFYWFDLVTWPGTLAINGDCGSYLFSRDIDMFAFFRGHRVNPQYWAEKVRAGKTVRYSPEKFRQYVGEHAEAMEPDWPGLTAAVEKCILGDLAEWDVEYEECAHEAMRDFTYLPEGGEGEPFSFMDGSDWDFRDYDWQFLWCCHAIVEGIRRYDEERTADLIAELAGADA